MSDSNVVPFNGVKVFSATMVRDRELLGEKVTDWMRSHPECVITDVRVTQSSDEQFHCIAITVFYNEDMTAAARSAPNGKRIKVQDGASR